VHKADSHPAPHLYFVITLPSKTHYSLYWRCISNYQC